MNIINETDFNAEGVQLQGPDGDCFTLILKGTFSIREQGLEIPDEQIPIFFGDEFYDGKDPLLVKYESDIVPFKPLSDIVLVGRAHAPEGKKARVLDTLVRVGRTAKKIRVFGHRKWVYSGFFIPEYATKPEPFDTMELTGDRAFGGIDRKGGGFCPENPSGIGFFCKKSKESVNGALLPNMENPADLIGKIMHHPRPTGFGFYGRSWAPRLNHVGTYDDDWQKNRSPKPPLDFDFRFYNGAYPDLQVKGFLKGDEEVELLNLSASSPMAFKLPGLKLSATVSFNTGEAGEKEILKMPLDTLALIPDEERLYMVWRCCFSLEDHPLGSIEKIILGLES